MNTKLTARSGASQDTTSLDPARPNIGTHRDYLAHAFRWNWAQRLVPKFLGELNPRLLDAGCGPTAPMAVELAVQPPIVDIASKTYIQYVGVDLNTIKPRVNPKWADYKSEFDLIARYPELIEEYGQFGMAVSFEVAEHMTKELQEEYIEAIRQCLIVGGRLVLSMPVLHPSGKMAKNHIAELETKDTQALLERHGFEIVDRFGTFASWHDIKDEVEKTSPEARELYNRLREFFSDNALACFMAPAFPDQSRNNAWIARRVS